LRDDPTNNLRTVEVYIDNKLSTVLPGLQRLSIPGLVNRQTYFIKLICVSQDGQRSGGIEIDVTPNPTSYVTPPVSGTDRDVSDLQAVVSSGRVDLSWVDPSGAGDSQINLDANSSKVQNFFILNFDVQGNPVYSEMTGWGSATVQDVDPARVVL
jgi:hypothetical protein